MEEGAIVWMKNFHGKEVSVPVFTGWLLRYRPAIEDRGRDEWYSTQMKAEIALAALGGRPVDQFTVDLTEEGCNPSTAWIAQVE